MIDLQFLVFKYMHLTQVNTFNKSLGRMAVKSGCWSRQLLPGLDRVNGFPLDLAVGSLAVGCRGQSEVYMRFISYVPPPSAIELKSQEGCRKRESPRPKQQSWKGVAAPQR